MDDRKMADRLFISSGDDFEAAGGVAEANEQISALCAYEKPVASTSQSFTRGCH